MKELRESRVRKASIISLASSCRPLPSSSNRRYLLELPAVVVLLENGDDGCSGFGLTTIGSAVRDEGAVVDPPRTDIPVDNHSPPLASRIVHLAVFS
jgi:hypothetical protein